MTAPDDRPRVASARTLLFVPGHRPDRFAKAAAAGADGIVLDLEDAVAPDSKDAARDHVLAWLSDGGTGIVRINGPATPWYDRDMAALAEHPRTVMLPKAERPHQISDLLARLPPGSAVVPLLETAAGVLDARAVCAVPGVIRAGFGSVDLAAELGVDPDDPTALAYTRSHLVLASAAAGVAPPLDGVTTALDDERALVADAERAAALGFTGKLCVHPRQVPPVNAAFTPSDEEREQARAIVRATADRAADGAVTVVNGRMVDRPVLERAHRLLNRP
ncbi:HpcH/HpaI aldolase/citrate lyase family protein [Streptomyces hokutonensis]|uniref:HpcH/HpaI aldolase/citrate lyase family protein n=1 Tax=Streptomyces hokutonensis TaxID=1306990 RepID=UPI0033EBA0C3